MCQFDVVSAGMVPSGLNSPKIGRLIEHFIAVLLIEVGKYDALSLSLSTRFLSNL